VTVSFLECCGWTQLWIWDSFPPLDYVPHPKRCRATALQSGKPLCGRGWQSVRGSEISATKPRHLERDTTCAETSKPCSASLQFVRKLSGFNKPSKANEAAFDQAIEDVAAIARRLIDSLVTTAEPRDREIEARRARARAAQWFGTS